EPAHEPQGGSAGVHKGARHLEEHACAHWGRRQCRTICQRNWELDWERGREWCSKERRVGAVGGRTRVGAGKDLELVRYV
ncbi:hypothetical protein HETIRDRAFT_382603, partial [Heterobasidion irregulare TC 32-1]